jgi:hypothetical protein
VGSGKTTELLSAQGRLNQLPDTRAFYVDVSKAHDITKMVPGAVAVQVGLALGEWLKSPASGVEGKLVPRYVKELQDIAHGYEFEPDYDNYAPFDNGRGVVRVPGLLVPPEKLEESVRTTLEPTEALLDVMHSRWKHAVFLLDGLDRMSDMAALELVVEHDIKALKSIGLGVVLVGPLRILYGSGFRETRWMTRVSMLSSMLPVASCATSSRSHNPRA